jgi:hypothetical protein
VTVRLARRPVTGRVTDDLTGAGVHAHVSADGRTAQAAANGAFSIWGPCAGDHLTASAPGHRSAHVAVSRGLTAHLVLPALVARDAFAGTPGLFASSSSSSAEVVQKAGGYHVRVRVAAKPVGVRQPIRSKARLRDVSVTATARRASGSPDDSFGVFCRWRGPRSYYLFELSADGFARIEKHAGGRALELRGWRPSTAIKPGGGANKLLAICRGYPATTLTVSVNGRTVASARDARGLPAGTVGVAASGYHPPGPLVVFDDVSVRRL